jgi:NAD(P)-dependent dehydrogenase (short-subunit alcohol dehydrogenase family)
MSNILITGASRGIGRAIAETLAAPDHTLYLHGRNRRAIDETCHLVEKKKATPIPVIADIGNDDGIDTVVGAVGDGQLDVLVNNAGVAHVAPIEDISRENWAETIAVNITAPVLLTQRLLPRIPAGGSIVNILSVAAQTAFPTWTAYCMSKFALDGFSKALREELRPKKIRVICIYPAATATELWQSIPGDWSTDAMMAPQQVADAVAFALARPSEVLTDSIGIGSLSGNQ